MHHHSIRPLLRGDLDRVRFLVQANAMFPPEMLDDMTAPFFGGADDQRWLVLDDGQVDAVCYFVPEAIADRVWNLLLIAVDPARHGEGLGSALMAAVERELAAQDIRLLLVDTSGTEAFARTRRFYEQLGYRREAVIRDYWANGDDKVTFVKSLS